MAYRRFQNTVAESRVTLPLIAVLALGSAVVSGLVSGQWWVQLLCVTLSVYLMIELSRRHQLLRVHSQMVPGAMLLLLTALSVLISDLRFAILCLCLTSFYSAFFRCYQRRQSSGWIYFGFLSLSLASMVFVQILYFVPFLWGAMAFNLYALNMRSWAASLLALLTPYWFTLAWMMCQGDVSWMAEHWSGLFAFAPLGCFERLTQHQWVNMGYVALLALVGIVHYRRQSYSDKIRTRMLYEVFILIDLFTLLFLAMQPQHYAPLMAMAVVSTAPLLAHFIALTHTWLTNIAFYLIILLTLTVSYYNLWMPSLNF